jgi:hypothetical protein
MELVTAWRQAQLAELVWDTPDGPDATVVVPLTDEGIACVALPFDQLARAEALAAAGGAVASVSDPALGGGAEPLRVRVRVTREDDLSAERFEDSKLLLQELAKHPPSRRRLDSILLRREHWWFLPRILLHLEPIDAPEPLEPTGALLAHRSAEGLELTTVRVTQRSSERLILEGAARSGPAVLLEHGAEAPDLERRWTFRRYGRLEGDSLLVTREESWGRSDRAPTLMQRIRDERALERGCREGLRIAGV